MCGICGLAGGGREEGLEMTGRMCAAMVHRGPDDEGIEYHDGVALGARRLSIIDLAGGHQPVTSEDKMVWAVQNGEIYNYRELRGQLEVLGHRFATRGDTEVLVHGYEEWGERLLEHLNGMFAFALHDRRRGLVLLARDRVGIKPLHYVIGEGRLAWASELKALLADARWRRGVDLAALEAYLRLEFVPSPEAMVAGVRKLRPGHYLVFDVARGEHEVKQWWTPRLSGELHSRRPLDEEAAALLEVLREAVRLELVADVPLGVFLSGGIDSSAVAAMMASLGGDVNSFSVAFADPSFDESRYARLVAEKLRTNHRELRVEPDDLLGLIPDLGQLLDEPLGDASLVPTHLLARFTRGHVKVALGGDGGDELFAGYPTILAHRMAGWYNRVPGLLRRGLVEPAVGMLPVNYDNWSFDYKAKRFVAAANLGVGERHARFMGSFSSAEARRLLSVEARAVLNVTGGGEDPVEAALDEAQAVGDENAALALDMRLYLENDILVKLDRASMMASLEGRVPMLNARMLEYVLNLPLDLKLRGMTGKYLLKRALRGVLPEEILQRPKKGFGIPVAKWFRGPLRGQLLEALEAGRLARQGLFDPQATGKLVDEHMAGTKDNRKQLWTLYAFQVWYEGYVGRGFTPGRQEAGAGVMLRGDD